MIERTNLAENAAKGSSGYVDCFIWHVVEDATRQGEYPNVTDAHVQAVVDAKWPRVWK